MGRVSKLVAFALILSTGVVATENRERPPREDRQERAHYESPLFSLLLLPVTLLLRIAAAISPQAERDRPETTAR